MHPDAPTHGDYRDWLLRSDRPLAIDLFCGAGGLSLGLEAAGYRVALAVDLDDWALETHSHNFEGIALKLDLGDPIVRNEIVELFDGVDVALVAGGPPCQPYSRAGRSKIRSLVENGTRDPEDNRRELWKAFLDIVVRIRPRAVLMENVPDMALNDDMSVLRLMFSQLETAGYEVDAKIVHAWHYGVPQHRQRLVLVGVRDGRAFSWPKKVEPVKLWDAIGDLPVLDPKCEVGAEVLPYQGPLSDFQRKARKRCDGDTEGLIFDHLTRAVRSDDLEVFKLMKPGTLYSDLPEELRRYRADIFDDKYNRLDWNGYSRSITAHIAKDGYWYIHPGQHRTLTVREAARIQTFPDHFRFAGFRSHQFAQIGNAVPPTLGEAIGGALLEATGQPAVRSTDRVSVWRDTIRSKLEVWARHDQVLASWSYPGEPWQVLVGILFGANGKLGWPNPNQVLQLIPSLQDATIQKLAILEVRSDPGRHRSAAQRLSRIALAVQSDADGWDGSSWIREAAFGPAARGWFNLLALDSGGLAPSSAALRVTARVTGSDVNERNRRSTGRMELSILVGSGSRGAMLNAAMHRLGNQICVADVPRCKGCPLKDFCRSAKC